MDNEGRSPLNSPADVIRLWAELGTRACDAKDRRQVDWLPVRELIELANEKLKVERARFIRLLEKSGNKLAPLSDPLAVNFGTHRWLKKQREESYSDWLHWIAEQLKPELLLEVFGIDRLFRVEGQEITRLQKLSFHADREYSIPAEYGGGRIDLLIWLRNQAGNRGLVAVEVKLGCADEADTKKQELYKLWLDAQSKRNYCILLAESGIEKEYHGGFKLLTWADVCVSLRQLVPSFVKDNRYVVASMILAFVGAVEQNLLGFPTRASKTVMHLEKYLEMKG